MLIDLHLQTSGTGEQKTKPTQNSVRELRGCGLSPDLVSPWWYEMLVIKWLSHPTCILFYSHGQYKFGICCIIKSEIINESYISKQIV